MTPIHLGRDQRYLPNDGQNLRRRCPEAKIFVGDILGASLFDPSHDPVEFIVDSTQRRQPMYPTMTINTVESAIFYLKNVRSPKMLIGRVVNIPYRFTFAIRAMTFSAFFVTSNNLPLNPHPVIALKISISGFEPLFFICVHNLSMQQEKQFFLHR